MINDKNLQQIYSMALQHIGASLIITDLDNNVVSVNDAFTRNYGYTLSEIKGNPIHTILSAHPDEDVTNNLIRTLKAKGLWEGEYVNRRKDGTEVHVWLISSMIYDDEGNAIGMMGVDVDITKRKQLEIDLNKKLKELETFTRLAVGRELKMKKIEDENEVLKKQIQILRENISGK